MQHVLTPGGDRQPPRLVYWPTHDGYTVGGLTQYEVKEEQVARFDARAVKISDQRMKAIRAAAEATGGHITRTTELHG